MTQFFLRFAALLWLVVVVALAILAWQKKTVIDTNVMSLLPAMQQQPLANIASKQVGQQFANQMLVMVSGSSSETTRASVEKTAVAFQQLPVVKKVFWYTSLDQLQAEYNNLYPYRYVLLSDQLKQKVSAGDYRFVSNQALAYLLNPVSTGKADLVNDPFYLFSAWQMQQSPQFNVRLENGFLRIPNETRASYLIVISLNHNAFDRTTQQQLFDQLQQLRTSLKPSGIDLIPSGLVVHAHAGAKQAEQEISTVGVGSLLGIVMMFFVVFNHFRLIPIIFLPVFVGCAVASAMLFLLMERVHIVTFSFGAGLIGVSIDYVLHYICERYKTKSVIRYLLPGLFLSLCTSVLAYATQAMTPFPGLRQMALFSVIGLVAAWITVVLWLPILTRFIQTQPVRGERALKKFLTLMPAIYRSRLLQVMLVCLVFGGSIGIMSGKAVDDVRLLQTSPESLLKQDAQIQKALNFRSFSKFLLVPCEELEQCLQQEEQIKPRLEVLKKQGVITDVDLLSGQLPSLKKQNHNLKQVEMLYQHELAKLFETVHTPSQLFDEAMNRFEQAHNDRLSLAKMPKSLLKNRLQNKIVETETQTMATVIALNHTASKSMDQALMQLKKDFPNIIYIDKIGTISELMRSYRIQVSQWASLAYIAIFIIFLVRYKLKAFRMLAPPFIASVLTVAILMQTTAGVNLFHTLALILLLGIGIDMSIFLTETQYAPQTWMAVTLSTITSLIAFGLLFLSNTPVLTHFGITILLGLSLVWLLTVIFRPSEVIQKAC